LLVGLNTLKILNKNWINLIGDNGSDSSFYAKTKPLTKTVELITHIKSNAHVIPIDVIEVCSQKIKYKFAGHIFEIIWDIPYFMGYGVLTLNGVELCSLRVYKDTIESAFNSLFPIEVVRQEKLKQFV
jgi:hypothetical protein